ncbi:unnamed protein product [Kuraishia capsulata CBS 1993]|uniref:TLC domain-containing protein n=1 Tax=Kuraishia capsulata CBS 1993 TaxID=1382522 RepID=W6MFI3_9ASCO|nr:uncharacterized protein KUCA_T00000058001 [Kuraishia capsulata CBS 1993]CDK24098.1 unnamed protein product [Kuraishia capsulata CBS 1993]
MPPKTTKKQTSSAAKGAANRRRKSSVGAINLGDTSVPGLGSRGSEQRNKKLDEALSKKDNSDLGISKKIFVGVKELCLRHVWLPFLLILVSVWSAYLLSDNHTESNPLRMFIDVSYEIPGTEPKMYGKGKKDFAFVAFYMLFFTFTREFTMQVILRPLAYRFGIQKEAKVKRFLEQMYAVSYYSFTGPLGLYIMKQTPLWFFETTAFYENFPHKTHDHLFKVYYLAQAAFWAQQSVILIFRLEAPRKDFKELVFHHIITIALIFLSYRFHFTWMGLAVYITMDISDWFLGLSKSFNYVNARITGPFFAVFTVVWFYLRHYLNIKILWSVLTEFRTVGPFELSWEDQQYKCWISQPIVFVLIFALQLVNLLWFFLILRILYRYVVLHVEEDVRSESESDNEEDAKKQN